MPTFCNETLAFLHAAGTARAAGASFGDHTDVKPASDRRGERATGYGVALLLSLLSPPTLEGAH